MIVAFILQAACLMFVLVVGHQSTLWFTISLVLTYFTWGEIFSLFPSTCGDYFGTRHATSNYAVLYTAKGVATAIGVSISSWLFTQFGTWSAAFYGSAALALVAVGLAVTLRRAGLARQEVPEGVRA
jgi:OFA family oxalate/formate antiporter-like MFS transporter